MGFASLDYSELNRNEEMCKTEHFLILHSFYCHFTACVKPNSSALTIPSDGLMSFCIVHLIYSLLLILHILHQLSTLHDFLCNSNDRLASQTCHQH
jgi:hypothetical protein